MSSYGADSESDTASLASDLSVLTTTPSPADAARIEEDFRDVSWYHGRLSRHNASSVLMQNGVDGCFLLRQSEHTPGQLTLSVRGLESVKHFNILVKDGIYCLSRTITFASGPEFVRYFEAQPVISGESGVLTQLTRPYPRTVPEFVDYDQIRILTPFKAAPAQRGSATDLSLVSKEGYLTKQGRIHKSWKTRWFVLGKDSLRYHRERGATEVLGSINLRECTAVAEDKTMGKLFCFRLTGPRRELVMFASSQAEMESWMGTLRWMLSKGTE